VSTATSTGRPRSVNGSVVGTSLPAPARHLAVVKVEDVNVARGVRCHTGEVIDVITKRQHDLR